MSNIPTQKKNKITTLKERIDHKKDPKILMIR